MAGLTTRVWDGLDELTSRWRQDAKWTPAVEASVRDREYHNWRKAVEKSFGRHAWRQPRVPAVPGPVSRTPAGGST
ncbi:hypothetical protein WJ438_33405 [Streptomyces sp. GD-15H]